MQQLVFREEQPVTSYEDPCRLLQHDWNDVFSTVTRRPWILTCTSSTSATSTIWRSTATVSCVRNVIDYGRPELHRHERTCTGDDIYKYPGGVYQQKIGITLTELPITLRWCYSLQTRDDPRSSSPVFSRIRVARSVVFCSVCRSLFVLLSFFVKPLYCLSFDLRLLIAPVVSTNFSWLLKSFISLSFYTYVVDIHCHSVEIN